MLGGKLCKLKMIVTLERSCSSIVQKSPALSRKPQNCPKVPAFSRKHCDCPKVPQIVQKAPELSKSPRFVQKSPICPKVPKSTWTALRHIPKSGLQKVNYKNGRSLQHIQTLGFSVCKGFLVAKLKCVSSPSLWWQQTFSINCPRLVWWQQHSRILVA